MSGTLTAFYSVASTWELDFDLNSVADWYVNHDVLHVKWNAEDDEYEEIEPTYAADEDTEMYKHPQKTVFV